VPNLLNKKILINENNKNSCEGEDGIDNEKMNQYLMKNEKFVYRPLLIFSEIFNSSSVQTLMAIGNRPAPLTLVGYYLNCLGNFIVDYINSKYNKNILLNRAEVKQIKIFNNQEFGIIVSRYSNSYYSDNNNNLENTEKNNNIIIKAKSLIIATGGKQDELNPYYSKIVDFKGSNNVFRSDFLLKEDGYEKMFKSFLNSYIPISINININNAKNNDFNIKKKKIVIIGGSHSGFSCAWILLNDPSTYKNIKLGTDYKPKFNPNCAECIKYTLKYKFLLNKYLKHQIRKTSKDISDKLNEDDIKINKNHLIDDDLNSEENIENEILDKDFVEKEINESNYQDELEKLKPCNCLGAVKDHIWKYEFLKEFENKDLSGILNLLESVNDNNLPDISLNKDIINNQRLLTGNLSSYENPDNLNCNTDIYKSNNNINLNNNNDKDLMDKKNILLNFISYIKKNLIEIQILFRDHIRVYYPSEQDAIDDNYNFFHKKEALNKQGKIYPFIGIRGDAKELYRKIIRGEEKRINLIRTSSNEEQRKYIQESDYVIWACGYNTNNVKILDSKNHPIEFYFEESGMVEVSKQLNILNKNKDPIKNLYGIGQGYSTKAPEIINGKKARADSIHLYNTHISQRLYNSLQGLFSKNSIDFNLRNANNSQTSNLNNLNNNMNININSAHATGFSGSYPNNNLVLNYRRKIEKNNLPPVAGNNTNKDNTENNLNLRKSSGGLTNEDISNNIYKNTGITNNNQVIINNNKYIKNNLNSNLVKNNNDFNANKNSLVNQTKKFTNNNNNGYNNHININATRMNSNGNNENSVNKNSNFNRIKVINQKNSNNINTNQVQVKTRNFINNKVLIQENPLIDLNHPLEINEISNTTNNFKETENSNFFKNDENNKITKKALNYNNCNEEKESEFQEKNSSENYDKKKCFINPINDNQIKIQNSSKRKPLTNIQQEAVIVNRQKSVNNQQSNLISPKILSMETPLNNRNPYIKSINKEIELFTKSNCDKQEIDKNRIPINCIIDINYEIIQQENNTPNNEINKNIQKELEKINSYTISKTSQNKSSYSNKSKQSTNLNLPGFNSLNDMNKQSQIYTNSCKESYSNNITKKFNSNNILANLNQNENVIINNDVLELTKNNFDLMGTLNLDNNNNENFNTDFLVNDDNSIERFLKHSESREHKKTILLVE